MQLIAHYIPQARETEGGKTYSIRVNPLMKIIVLQQCRQHTVTHTDNTNLHAVRSTLQLSRDSQHIVPGPAGMYCRSIHTYTSNQYHQSTGVVRNSGPKGVHI